MSFKRLNGKCQINIVFLIIGFCLQSFIWFRIAQTENHPDIIYLGFWAVASFTFVILFFANKYIKRTLTARISVLITTFIIAVIGPLWMYMTYFINLDPQSGIAVVAEPFLGLILCAIAIAITIPLNCTSNR